MILNRRFSTSRIIKFAKHKHWADEVNKTTNIDRAFEHFDDLYGSVYTQKWPSMRLGLTCPQKYIAIPNTFLDVGPVADKLEWLGAYDLKSLWERGKVKLQDEVPKTINAEDEKQRQDEVEKTLKSIAQTKVAEELDVLYQNAPKEKIPGRLEETGDRRVIGDIKEAAAEHLTTSKLKGVEDYQFESEYYSFYQEKPLKSLSDNNNSQSLSSSIYKFTSQSDCTNLKFPPLIRPYTFVAGSSSNFPTANRSSGLRDWLCVNGASIVPIIALDFHPEVNFLDLCAGPGTKSLLSLMTMCPAILKLNDLEYTRMSRIRRIFKEFTGADEHPNVVYTRFNAAHYPTSPEFHRVLADVPCSSDRISATISDNSIFKQNRIRERLNIVKVQKSILMSGFKSLLREPGSVCVYSTCTLSPIENDGAVAAALRETDVPDLVVDLESLMNALLPFQAIDLFKFSRTKFGVLIEPTIFSNFGPMYVSRIVYLPSHASSAAYAS